MVEYSFYLLSVVTEGITVHGKTIQHWTQGSNPHGKELNLVLQGLYIVDDLIQNEGLPSNLVTARDQGLQHPHPLTDSLPPDPLCKAVAVCCLASPCPDMDVPLRCLLLIYLLAVSLPLSGTLL
uniref:Uncharacterized protein n=1 Tax=Arundo donax TaxID=35708 RepID=A0A0A9ETZ8_ARUDO